MAATRFGSVPAAAFFEADVFFATGSDFFAADLFDLAFLMFFARMAGKNITR
jgi:hypothetical protein